MGSGSENRFLSEGIEDVLRQYFDAPAGLAYVIAPFIIPGTLDRLLGHRSGSQTIVVTSWRMEHLVAGVSSLDIFPLCQRHDWTLYINNALHAKLYSHSLRSAWIGSANVTDPGVGAAEESNIEALYRVDPLVREMRIWISQLVARSRYVTKSIHEWYTNWLKRQPAPPATALVPPAHTDTGYDPFLISQLPASRSPRRLWMVLNEPEAAEAEDWDAVAAAEHDVAVYSVDPSCTYERFLRLLRPAFLKQPFVRNLTVFLSEHERRFGEVKAWIQENCTDVPVPYRRELTPYVQNIYAWLTALAPERFEVVRPRHSEIIRRKDS